MLDKIILFSIKNKLFVGFMTLMLIFWGVWSATRLSIDAVPDITNNQVQIITSTPTLASQEVEQLVTFPIEQSTASGKMVIRVPQSLQAPMRRQKERLTVAAYTITARGLGSADYCAFDAIIVYYDRGKDALNTPAGNRAQSLGLMIMISGASNSIRRFRRAFLLMTRR